MLTGKPYFMVGIKVSGCLYDIRINDVTVTEEIRGLPMSADLPVNQFMLSGKNLLSMHLRPIGEETELSPSAEVSASLLIRQSGTPRESNQTIASLRYRAGREELEDRIAGSTPTGKKDSTNGFLSSDTGDVNVDSIESLSTPDGKGVIIRREIELTTSIPRWAWLDSDDIPETEETRKELSLQYQKIWDLLKSGNVQGKLPPLFAERTKELATAFYSSEPEMAPNGLEEVVANQEYEIADMYLDHALFRILGKGKLARFLFWNGMPLINFNHKTEEMSKNFEIMFRKSGGDWIITR